MSLLALTVSASDLPLTCQHTHRHWVSGIHFQQHITMRWTHRYRKACGFPRIYVVFQLSVIWKVFKGYSALLKNVIGYIKDAGDVILHVKVQVVGSKPTWHTSHNSRLVFFFFFCHNLWVELSLSSQMPRRHVVNDSSHILFSEPFHICSRSGINLAPLDCKTVIIYSPIPCWGTQLLPGVKFILSMLFSYMHTVIERNYAILSVALSLNTDSLTDYFSLH